MYNSKHCAKKWSEIPSKRLLVVDKACQKRASGLGGYCLSHPEPCGFVLGCCVVWQAGANSQTSGDLVGLEVLDWLE